MVDRAERQRRRRALHREGLVRRRGIRRGLRGPVLAHRGRSPGEGLTATIFSIGHGARSASDLIAVLQDAGIRRLVDVRTAPGSRKHPQFGRDALADALASAGIAYRWEKD